MNHDRAQLAKLGQTPPKTPTSLSAAHCVHCGRVYIFGDKDGREDCDCGAELYPVTKDVTPGQELRCGDSTQVRAVIGDRDKLWQVCREFVEKQQILCSESVYQCDNVILNAHEFIEAVCDLVGYHTPKEDE